MQPSDLKGSCLDFVFRRCIRCTAFLGWRVVAEKTPRRGSVSVLLKHAYVVTVDPDRRVIPDGWILVEGDSIAGLGSMAEPGTGTADQEIDLHGMLAMPGLLNGHMHHWGTLFKNTGEGLLLEPWLDEVALPLLFNLTNEDLRVAAYMDAIAQLHTGTTCTLNHIVNINDHDSMAAISRAGP